MESLASELGVLFERLNEIRLYRPVSEMDQIGFAADLQHARKTLKAYQHKLAGLEGILSMCEDAFNDLMGVQP